MQYYDHHDIDNMTRRFRAQFVNCLSGFKSANLIGTQNIKGVTNLAIISSVIHLGSDPAMLGFISRPHSTSRHTLENIIQSQQYTINHVHEQMIANAHQTSARYPADQSEFDQCQFTPEFIKQFGAPAVAESRLQIGMQLEEIIPIPSNNTQLVVGKVRWLRVPQDKVLADGTISIEQLKTVTIAGLDSYHSTRQLARYEYAKPDLPPREIEP